MEMIHSNIVLNCINVYLRTINELIWRKKIDDLKIILSTNIIKD